MKRTAVLLNLDDLNDSLNIVKRMQGIATYTKLDYLKIIDMFTDEKNVTQRVVYVTKYPRRPMQKAFLDFFRNNGFGVVTSLPKTITRYDSQEDKELPANFDIKMTQAIWKHVMLRSCDEMIIAANNPDFASVAKETKQFGFPIHIIGARKTLTSEQDMSTFFLDDVDIQKFIRKSSKKWCDMYTVNGSVIKIPKDHNDPWEFIFCHYEKFNLSKINNPYKTPVMCKKIH